jgi:hypothetical protein
MLEAAQQTVMVNTALCFKTCTAAIPFLNTLFIHLLLVHLLNVMNTMKMSETDNRCNW